MFNDLGNYDGTVEGFTHDVIASTTRAWQAIFAENDMDTSYVEPELILFEDAIITPNGHLTSGGGIRYFPEEGRIYYPIGFKSSLERTLKIEEGSTPHFWAACAIAHDVGHHVQVQLGRDFPTEFETERGAMEKVALETEADSFAGAWAQHAYREQGIIDKSTAKNAAHFFYLVGDDNIQGKDIVSPQHGTSEQREQAYTYGFNN